MVSILVGEEDPILMTERNIYVSYNGGDQTYIHKIYVKGLSFIPYADGRVKGILKEIGSMDEFGGALLRVVSSRGLMRAISQGS